jgi:hypothetical protein
MSNRKSITCKSCGLSFGTGLSFDNHRVTMGRCLTIEEMQARGMSQNKYGLWVSTKKQMKMKGW